MQILKITLIVAVLKLSPTLYLLFVPKVAAKEAVATLGQCSFKYEKEAARGRQLKTVTHGTASSIRLELTCVIIISTVFPTRVK